MNGCKLSEGRFSFNFEKSILSVKADNPTFNGLGGVDFIIELEDRFVFVEVKDLEDKRVPPEQRAEWVRKLKIGKDNPFLIDMGIKFKDTVLRKWANNEEFDKPIWFTVILQLNDMDAAMKIKLSEDLSGKLPTCIGEKYGFKKNLRIKRREIISVDDWQNRYPEFPITEVV